MVVLESVRRQYSTRSVVFDILKTFKRHRVFIVVSWFIWMCVCLFLNVYFVFIYLFNFMYWKNRRGINFSYKYLASISVNSTWAVVKSQIKIKQLKNYYDRRYYSPKHLNNHVCKCHTLKYTGMPNLFQNKTKILHMQVTSIFFRHNLTI